MQEAVSRSLWDIAAAKRCDVLFGASRKGVCNKPYFMETGKFSGGAFFTYNCEAQIMVELANAPT
jgi:hypothetical protein